jgi:hypothetical protein
LADYTFAYVEFGAAITMEDCEFSSICKFSFFFYFYFTILFLELICGDKTLGGLEVGAVVHGLIASGKLISIKRCIFTNCGIGSSGSSSDSIGGIIYGYGEGKLSFENNTMSSGSESIEYGGGIYADGVFENCFFFLLRKYCYSD